MSIFVKPVQYCHNFCFFLEISSQEMDPSLWFLGNGPFSLILRKWTLLSDSQEMDPSLWFLGNGPFSLILRKWTLLSDS